MKKALGFLLTLTLILTAVPFAPAEEAAWTVRTVPVVREGEADGAMDLRFYAECPHVPYFGMKAYAAMMTDVELTVTPRDGGRWEVSNPNGSSVLADPAAGTITAPDWARFMNPPGPYTTQAGVKDTPCAWSEYPELVFEDDPAAVVFRFADYGIAIHADADDVYLPLGLLSTMLTDLANNCLLFNGETAFRPVVNVENLSGVPDGYYESEQMKALLTGEAQREEDEIRESYGELCFILDYFFGYPGAAPLDPAMAEKGFEAALLEFPDGTGPELAAGLLSPDMGTYLIALTRIFFELLDDGHTAFTGLTGLMNDPAAFPALYQRILSQTFGILLASSSMAKQNLLAAIPPERAAAWGKETYRECGSTAILRIDTFIPDIAGWEAYYAGTGELPEDALGITWTGLKRASENPEIKNVLFDLSANTGGSGDLLMAMIDLATGYPLFRGYNVLTGQREYAEARTDRNLDGVIDEKDDEVRYDFRYGVLTTRLSFSCGNLFPFMMQEQGAVLIGEPSGGGSCCVQTATLSNGMVFVMSSCQWALRTETGDSLEDGCRTDLPIARIEPESPTNDNPRLSLGDYSPFFDDVMLDRMMNDWFGAEEEAPAA